MGTSHITTLGLYKMQHPKLLRLCWRSFSDWGWDHVAFTLAHQGCQYVDYGYQLANGIPMDLQTRSKTVDAVLTLTFRIWLLPCRLLFCPQRLPILRLGITASKSVSDALTYHRKYRWHSIDTRYQNVAVTAPRSLLPAQAACLLNMNSREQITFRLSCLHIQKSFTLHWRSL